MTKLGVLIAFIFIMTGSARAFEMFQLPNGDYQYTYGVGELAPPYSDIVASGVFDSSTMGVSYLFQNRYNGEMVAMFQLKYGWKGFPTKAVYYFAKGSYNGVAWYDLGIIEMPLP